MEVHSKKVLIVEDDVLLSVVEKRLIQKMGHEVVDVIDNGKQALEFVRVEEPDIILMDIKLKGEWDGIETAQEIRKHSSIPIVYLSGCSDTESRNRAEVIGFSDYLIKPVQMSDLEKTFSIVFDQESIAKPPTSKISKKRVNYS